MQLRPSCLVRHMVLIAATLSLASVWSVFAVYVLHAAYLFDAISLPFENQSVTQSLTPEGWAFFTRDPRRAELYVFTQTGGRWEPAHVGVHGRGTLSLGFDRSGRRGQNEAYELLAEFGDAPVTICRGPTSTCLSGNIHMVQVRNPFPRPILCKNIALVTASPVPWAWSTLKSTVYMPKEIRLMNVIC